MVTDAREVNRNYPVPSTDNTIAVDIARIGLALAAIGVDVSDLLDAVAAKAAAVHQHEIADVVGLIAALNAKAAADHTHALGGLSDVDTAGAATYQVLAKAVDGQWRPWTIDLANAIGAAAYARLDGAAFTGPTTVPTVTTAVDSLNAVNVTMVRSAIAALVAASPSTLDTLNELAAALGNDPDFATTVSNALANRLRIDTPQTLTFDQQKGLWAAQSVMPRLSTGAALPTADIGPIWHDDYAGVMTWQVFSANGAAYAGYASVGVGRPSYDAQSTARAGYLKRNGATVSKTAYAALWHWALHNGRVLGAGSWIAGHDVFGNVDAVTFKLPDLRGESMRAWDDGRGIDSGRIFGSLQLDQMQQITGSAETAIHASGSEAMIVSADGALSVKGAKGASYVTSFGGPNIQNDGITFNSANSPGARTGSETRPRNVAFLADIKF